MWYSLRLNNFQAVRAFFALETRLIAVFAVAAVADLARALNVADVLLTSSPANGWR